MTKYEEFLQTKEVLENLERRKRTVPCLNLVQKILKNTPESANELFQLLLDFKCKVEEGIGEKE